MWDKKSLSSARFEYSQFNPHLFVLVFHGAPFLKGRNVQPEKLAGATAIPATFALCEIKISTWCPFKLRLSEPAK